MSQAPIFRRGLMLVLSSPAGAGKTTITRRMLELEPDCALSVSVTTRAPRVHEQDGDHYFFIAEAEFRRMIAAGELLEHARVFGNHYGTPRAAVEKTLAEGRDVITDIDWQGTQQLAQSFRSDLVSVFILPPALGELERRLRGRAQDSDSVIAQRMAKASDEMSHWPEYDYVVINRELDASVATVRAILAAERVRRVRQPGLVEFVRGLRGVAS